MINIKEEIFWPEVNEIFLIEDNIKYIIQINGKTRKVIETKKDISEDTLIAKIKEDNKLNTFLNNRNIQKKIFIPNKLINLIIN
jgi:leucyl-tRNA synthetase